MAIDEETPLKTDADESPKKPGIGRLVVGVAVALAVVGFLAFASASFVSKAASSPLALEETEEETISPEAISKAFSSSGSEIHSEPWSGKCRLS